MKRKYIIIGIVFLSMILALGYHFLTKPIYESTSMVRIGQVGHLSGQVTLLENPHILVNQLTEKYSGGNPRLASISIVKNNGADTSLIKLTAQGNLAEEAKDYLTKVNDELLKDHDMLYNSMISKKVTILTSFKTELEKVNSKIDIFDKQINSLKGRDDSLGALLVQQKLSLEEQRVLLESQIADLEMYLEKPFTFPTSVFRQPSLQPGAVNKKPMFNIGLAGMLGLMFGVFLVFFLDYMEKQKIAHLNCK